MKKEKKSILLSLLVIGAVALLITAGTTATFTDQVTSTDNEIQNAIIMISVDGECTDREFGSSPDNPNVPGEEGCEYDAIATDFTATKLLPGEYDEHEFVVTNDGNRQGDLTVSFANKTSSVVACATSNWTIEATGNSGTTENLDPGDTHEVTVKVTLESTAGNVCQDATLTFDVVFDFEHAAAPTDTQYP
jgi:predicted ribosomally synthesized peptide with SipW-like signal peptide